ncbi:hypothetical protein [Sphingomonas quercus]|uniref:Gasdermin bGSDM n=1 Tax=Sphingomonas quercus TaxID=2842451 RepID=A0ABS6BMC3_9SPHN|nr:hypothetical protein [Sphingomonas quercus]MBU3078926.1 hypothetical protein [Sphingomonas quercus]
MGLIPNCKDPALTALKAMGYNVVRLPKADLTPTLLLARKGSKLQRIGSLTSVFTPAPAAPVPAISADNPAPNVSGTKSADIDIGIGLNILGGLISALGGSTLALNAGYTQARSVQFEFAGVLESNAEPALLDQFFAGATINPFAHAISDMLDSDDVFVITSTLKSSKINVAAKDDHKNSIGLDVPVIQGAVGGSLKVSGSGASSSVVTYEGQVPLVFGFQAVRLIFDDGRYRTMKLADAGSIALEAALGEGPQGYVYLDQGGLIATDL